MRTPLHNFVSEATNLLW